MRFEFIHAKKANYPIRILCRVLDVSSSGYNWVWSPSSPRHGLLLGGYADGRRSTLDLLGWEPWADVAEPLAVLRERYNITATPV